MVNCQADCQVSHPIRFFEWNNVRMLPNAPRQNACSGSGRSNYKNRFVYSLFHFDSKTSAESVRLVLAADSNDWRAAQKAYPIKCPCYYVAMPMAMKQRYEGPPGRAPLESLHTVTLLSNSTP